jgi:hypothetical protein
MRTCSSVTRKYCLKVFLRWILYYIFVFSSRFSNFSLNFGSASIAEVVSNPAVLAEVNHFSLYFVGALNEPFDLGEPHIILHFAGLNCHASSVRYAVATKNSKFSISEFIRTELLFSLSIHRKFRRIQVTYSWYHLSGHGLLLHSPLAIPTQCHRMCVCP